MFENNPDYTLSHTHDEQHNRPTKRPRSGPPPNGYHDPAILGVTEVPATSTEKPKNGPIPPVQRVQEKDKNRRLSCKECRRRVDSFPGYLVF